MSDHRRTVRDTCRVTGKRGRWCACFDRSDPCQIHVHPIGDLIHHDLDADCVCGPIVVLLTATDEDGVVGDAWRYDHSSLDGREAPEIAHEQVTE